MKTELILSQKQVISQQMQLSVKILQMNAVELDQYVRDATLENPVIELETPHDNETKKEERVSKLEWLESMDESNYSKYSHHFSEKETEQPLYERDQTESLQDTLLMQLPGLYLDISLEKVVRYLICTLDGNGYLTTPAQQLLDELQVESSVLEQAVQVLHRMDPAGVGAANLQECLLIQAKRQTPPNPRLISLIENYLDILAKNQMSKLASLLGVSMEEMKGIRDQLLKLNPKPGNGYKSHDVISYIRPDVFIVHFENEFQIILNDYQQPRIQLSGYYKKMAAEAPAEATKYLNTKISQAEWMLTCIRQRKETILKCAEKILQWQIRFFQKGPGYLVPMTLSDIAAQVNMHPSTVSRATSEKYLQCQWGVFRIGDLFSRQVGDSEDSQSQDMILDLMKKIFDGEDKSAPLSDQQIVERLQTSGVTIARRTVAKYRGQLGVPTASKRRHF